MTDLPTLNRLRVNAGKTELKSWKASGDKLLEAIEKLRSQGFVDTVPGAKLDAEPVSEDPAVIKAREEQPPSLADSALAKNIANPEKKEKETTKQRVALARGLDSEPYAHHCRQRIQDHRAAEKKAIKLSKQDKKQIKDEAEDRKPKRIAGEVDPKVDPAKAARQKKHIEEKRAAREAKPKVEKNDKEITVAEVARKLGIDPKTARQKLRRHEAKLLHLHTQGQDRWTFPKSAEADITKLLK